MARILIIEDNADIAYSLAHNLARDDEHVVTVASDGSEGLRAAFSPPVPDLVLLDLGLPGMDGTEVCRRLRKDPSTAAVPVIMLTARVAESDRVGGLELGADDYVTKPFSVKEVVARVRAVLRRTGRGEEAEEVLDGPIRVDLAARRVHVGDDEAVLTRKEFDLLVELMRHRGRVLTRERLLEGVWGYDFPGETRTVDVHIRRLRKKIGGPAEERIETVVGVGYRWKQPS